jgi:TonB family protein
MPHPPGFLTISFVIVVLWLCPGSFYLLAVAQVSSVPEQVRGLELVTQGKFKEAAKVLRKAVDKNNKDPDTWYYLGLALLQQEDETKNAIKAFENTVQLRPDFVEARLGLSYALLRGNKLHAARREAQAILIDHPRIAGAHYVVGAVHLRSGTNDEGALAEAEQAITLDPKLASPYLLKAQAIVSIYGTNALRNSRAPSTAPAVAEHLQVRKAPPERSLLSQAADSLETYISLSSSDSSAAWWQEQLATLRFFGGAFRDKLNDVGEVFPGSKVDTRARVLSKPEPTYTQAAKQAKVSGRIVLMGVFSAEGTVRHLLVLQGLPYGMTEEALKAARRIKFVPATIDGKPVSTFIQLQYQFNLY